MTTTHNDVFAWKRIGDRWAEAQGYGSIEGVPAKQQGALVKAVVAGSEGATAAEVREALLGAAIAATETRRRATTVTDPGGEASAGTTTGQVWNGKTAKGPVGLWVSLFGGGNKEEGDPLVQSRANGTTFKDLDERAFEPELRAGLKRGFDLPGTVQVGPTCGLQLLVSIFDALQARRPNETQLLNPLVRAEDASREGSHTQAVDTAETLLDVARQHKFTEGGEIFTAKDMVTLAQYFGYRAEMTAKATLEDVRSALDNGASVMIAIDVDRDGNPGLFNGSRAHWVGLEGTFERDGVDYVIGTHTWSGAEYVWTAEQVFQSSQQLKIADQELFPHAPADLSKTLAGRMIAVSAG